MDAQYQQCSQYRGGGQQVQTGCRRMEGAFGPVLDDRRDEAAEGTE